ncbi:DUF2247 family protein [Cytobacillus oceanisediminis]|uniref:DUF2247 family protein n=1 Tax=Cytobacillus oceanisediminis TaxID=665099 RepID=UPI001C2180A5|nr:DUF2247 family protein [Cytobacillus oceanisediminis]MBU8773147.1 DUF2247 family protein [Cytobacillus oceanisediminis]
MDISVDIFKHNKINYDWRTLYVGMKMDVIKINDITNYAVEFLANHHEINNPNIIQLAWGGEDIDYECLLENILNDSNIKELNLDSDVWEIEKRKWRFGILAYLNIKHQDDYEELLNKIAEVYADFNYPEDMDSFINYLTPQDNTNPSLYSKEENITRLINLFYDFLNKEHRCLQNDTIF